LSELKCFWYKKETANKAAIQAFIVNRTGDFAFIIVGYISS
jgi:NADH-quinone oxidoreductase subunit L